jgi:class 3 adenylate cyclase
MQRILAGATMGTSMSELPVGTVTFVFTDIEGSTRLLKRLGAGYAGLLSRHRQLVRNALEECNGREMDTQGEGFFLAFGRAKDAVAAAVAIQRAHDDEAWPEGADVRVRIGMHTSEPELSNDRYVGLGVHRAARICAVGHGGQVLASRSTAGLVDEEEHPGIEFRDLGEHQLKDLDRSERIYQLVAPGLAADFSPLRSLTEIGRSAEAALPSGTVTFLVTDIVGSTRLVREAGGETAGLVLEEYERILRDATEQAGGHVFEVAGDSFIAAFVRGRDALATAASATAAFAAADWPEARPPAVRIGLHTGEASPTKARYIGLTLPRAFRVCNSASAGQVLLSESTEGVLDPSVIDSFVIRDLGTRRLDDFDRPVRLYELVV